MKKIGVLNLKKPPNQTPQQKKSTPKQQKTQEPCKEEKKPYKNTHTQNKINKKNPTAPNNKGNVNVEGKKNETMHNIHSIMRIRIHQSS